MSKIKPVAAIDALFSGMALLTVSGISKKEKDHWVLRNINFEQQPHQKIAIAGETGSGKTTLLKMIGGWAQPDSGEIRFNGDRVAGLHEKLLPGHPGIAYLSQQFELPNHFWVHEILEYANQLNRKDALALYQVCRIDHLLDRRSNQLSGGERQRIALARLLSSSPRLLLLDEPFSNLDAMHKAIIKSVLHDIGERLSISCILVSHDAPDILSWADTILLMRDGQLIQQAAPEVIYKQPLDEYCAGILGDYSVFQITDAPFPAEGNGGRKKLFLRPENIHLSTTTGNNGLQGRIERKSYWGSHYTVDIALNKQVLTARTTDEQWMPGDPVYVSFDKTTVWYI